MGKDSGIQWTHDTANLWWGCKEVHAGCDHCYARVLAKSKGKAAAWDGVRFATKGIWANLYKWQRLALESGEDRRIFTGSMMDIFEKSLPASDRQGRPMGMTTGDLRDRYFEEVVPATPNLIHLLLTKRPGNIPSMVPSSWLTTWPSNVMTGTSPVDQATADILVPQLLKVPGPHFLSVEPMLGPIDLANVRWQLPDSIGVVRGSVLGHTDGSTFSPRGAKGQGVAWVICGGESGHGARRFDMQWACDLRDQCKGAGVSFFMKQLGSNPVGWRWNEDRSKLRDSHGGNWDEWPCEDLKIREFPAREGARA